MRLPGIQYLSHEWLDMTGRCECQITYVKNQGNNSVFVVEYVPARPEPFHSIFQRWQASWLVFTGQADALVWPETYRKWWPKGE